MLSVGGALGAIGGVTGLVVGLAVHWPTAPVAVLEVGFPATIGGGVIGLAIGTVVHIARVVRRHWQP